MMAMLLWTRLRRNCFLQTRFNSYCQIGHEIEMLLFLKRINSAMKKEIDQNKDRRDPPSRQVPIIF